MTTDLHRPPMSQPMPAGPASGGPAIRTPETRVRVFVSSTLHELAKERLAVRGAIERLRLTPVLFEAGARAHAAADIYRAYLEQSHVFIGVYGADYGAITPEGSLSGIEDEYERSATLPRLLYVKDVRPRDPRLEALLDRVREDGRAVYRSFSTPDELGRIVADDLAALLSEDFIDRHGTPSPMPLVPLIAQAPIPSTRTFGRERELAALERDLRAGRRLVTVTGPGGVGKSRLALEVAHRVGDQFPDGVVFVPLDEVRDAELVMIRLAQALGIRHHAHRPALETVVERLTGLRVLLVLDNMEHLLPAAPALADLVDRAAGVSALVTSRTRLHLRGETLHPLGGLGLPDSDADPEAVRSAAAARLFVDRALATDPSFQLTDADVPVVGEIVRQLDGLPLAIELAAARVRLLPPASLLAHLGEGQVGSGTGTSDMPSRHHTLASTIDWSVDLLNDAELAMFARMSVFASGADLDAVEQVVAGSPVGDVLATLAALVDHSLVHRTGSHGTARVQMLSTIRQRATRLLDERGEGDAIRRRHAQYFAALVRTDDPLGRSAAESWPMLETESANLLEAGMWAAAEGDATLVPVFVRGLWDWLWSTGRHQVLRDGVRLALRRVDSSVAPDDLALLHLVAALTEGATGQIGSAKRAADRAIGLADQARGTAGVAAAAHLVRARLRLWSGQPGAGHDLRIALRICQAEPVPWIEVSSAVTRGLLRAGRGYGVGAGADVDRARSAASGDAGLEGLARLATITVQALSGTPDDLRPMLAEVIQRPAALRQSESLVLALDAAAAVAATARRWDDVVATTAAADALARPLDSRPWPTARDDATSPIGRARAATHPVVLASIAETARSADPHDVLRCAVLRSGCGGLPESGYRVGW